MSKIIRELNWMDVRAFCKVITSDSPDYPIRLTVSANDCNININGYIRHESLFAVRDLLLLQDGNFDGSLINKRYK
jgi:hypothetical protein